MTSQGSTPALVAVGGWIASGKSTLARGLAERGGAELLVADDHLALREILGRGSKRAG